MRTAHCFFFIGRMSASDMKRSGMEVRSSHCFFIERMLATELEPAEARYAQLIVFLYRTNVCERHGVKRNGGAQFSFRRMQVFPGIFASCYGKISL